MAAVLAQGAMRAAASVVPQVPRDCNERNEHRRFARTDVSYTAGVGDRQQTRGTKPNLLLEKGLRQSDLAQFLAYDRRACDLAVGDTIWAEFV
jgi:hypothetical protein